MPTASNQSQFSQSQLNYSKANSERIIDFVQNYDRNQNINTVKFCECATNNTIKDKYH